MVHDDDVEALAQLRDIRAHGAAHRLAKLIKENARLRRENRELRSCTDLAAACSKAVLQRLLSSERRPG